MVSRKNIGEASGWITQPHIMAGKWIGNEIGSWIKGNNERVEAKSQAPMMNNYKSNLNLTTYNPRYPYFDEEDYKKLEQGAINRGLTGDEKTQFMDEAYQYYYPQVLNQHGLNARAEEINKSAAENGEAILNGDKNVAWNMKLVDLSQTAKRVKGIAYDYPDNLVIESMKNNIPDGEQLLLNYLNNGDDTLLYKAGLKKTDAQTKMEEYNKKKENINRVLVQNWKELSDDGLKYLRDYNVMFQVVDEARVQGLGQGMSDNELLLNLIYQSPELQQLEKELDSLQLDKEDEAILGITDNEREKRKNEKSNSFRDWIGLNSDSPATLEDLAEEIYVRENMDGQTWKNFQANWRNWGDSLAKFGYRAPRDYRNFAADTDLARFGAKLFGGMTDEEVEQRIQDIKTRNINEVKNFNEMTDKEQEAYKKKIGLDPIIENYYNNQGLVESLLNEDVRGFGYKSAGDVAGNVDMLAGIGASIINPALGLAIMGTDTFARENQEAFDSLIDAQTKQGVSYEDAYDSASKGAVVVGAINTAIELGLEKVLGGVETSTAKNIKELATKNLNKEVSEMIAKRGIADMLANGLETQARSSLEEGMEEVFQQMVQNIAASDFDPDKKISDDLWRAFESGALNPMNLLAGGSEITKGYMENKDSINQSVMNGVNNTKTFVSENLNPQNIINNLKKNKEGGNVTTEGDVAVEGTEMVTEKTEKPGIIDRITDWGAEKITNTVSAQDKLYKAQEPRMNILSKKKDLEKRRANSDRSNQLIVQNGYTPTNTAERLEAHEATMKKIWGQVEDKINGGQEIMVDLSQIADVLDEYIQSQRDTKSTLTEGDLAKLEKESQALRGQQVSLPVAERLKQLYNAVINNRGEEKASDTMANGLKKATHEIGVIEDNLLSKIPGEFQGLKNDFGALKDTYEDVFKADMKNQRKKGLGLTETYSRIEGIGDIANGLLGVATGKGDIASIGKGAAKFLVGKSLAKASDVDFLIEQGFKELAKQYGNNGNVTTNITSTTPTAPTTQITEDIDVGANPTDLTATEEVMEEEVTTTPKKKTSKKQTENKVKLDTKKIASDYMKGEMDWNKYQHLAGLTEEQALEKRGNFETAIDEEWDKNQDYYNTHQSELVEKFHHLLK